MITTPSDPRRAELAHVRATNRAVVLRCVREQAPCSRADIAAATGLNKTTVSSLVSELLERRLLREIGMTGNRVGRPAMMLTLDGASYAAIGIEVNVDHLTAVAVDLAGQPVLSWRRSFPGATERGPRSVTAVAALARRVIARTERDGRQVLGLSVAVPGLVDPHGRVSDAPGLGWRDVDVVGDLTRALREPGFLVDVGNDANLAALAEHRFGPHAGVSDLVYLTGEAGLGAGMIVDGRLRRGSAGYGGEAAHIQIDPAGPLCRCGRRGCLEALAGIGAVVRRASANGDEPDARDGTVPFSDLEPEVDEVVARARAGDRQVLAALEAAGRDLGAGVAVLVNLLNPRTVVLGGHYAALAPWLLPAVDKELQERAAVPGGGGCQVVASTLQRDAAALGGAARVLEAVDAGRLPFD
ncbi:ROK family protein [Allonocardiopsis opalescens]|uniref:Putative NBD/HSP70 family sugar kinase n=1 Tax=Allonocardiopsis opalescens TaxID=1144618 RepID=A0A2T0PXC4_9ACTN|nr:ROK family protein [Allonocardiopsis opalescens]PRX96088.1 putative NBD/HSP70 family sugar kinase [Allonocardiopsis opalescens]